MISPGDLMEKIGLVNPRDKTKVFVHPESTADMLKKFEHIRYNQIHIGGYRITVIESEHMPEGIILFGGKIFKLEGSDDGCKGTPAE